MSHYATRRSSELSQTAVRELISRFRREFVMQFRIIPMTSNLLNQAMDLAQAHALRGYDAIQLASAVQLASRSELLHIRMLFISADAELNAAAAAHGMAVEDPNRHN